MEYLHELLKELDSVTTPSSYLLSKVFKAFRKSKVRRPDVYAIHGPTYCKRLNNVDKFSFYEQIFIGALDHGDLNLARTHLAALQSQFHGQGGGAEGSSNRVKRLEGMMAESTGDFDAALKLYDEILEANPANLLVMKRKVAALRSQGKNKQAIEALHAILTMFQSDTASWLELADMHLSLCDYQSAAFCYEEVILVMPTSAPLYCRLAETLYTLGGAENLVKARQYYSLSLAQQKAKNNRRALFGLLATCREIQALPAKRVPEGEVEVSEALHTWCLEQLGGGAEGGIAGLVAGALCT